MRKTLSIILLTLLLPAPAIWAQETNALLFTQIERDPVNAALAGAGSAYAGNASVKAFSGAALLPFTEGKQDASLGYQHWAADASNQLQAAASFRAMPGLVLSAGYAFSAGPSFDELGEYGQYVGTVRPVSHLVALGAGLGLGEQWSVGVNLRYALEKAGETKGGLSADISAAWQPLAQLRVMAGVSTLGTAVASQDGTRYQQPASGRLGADWSLALAQDHALDVMASADVFFSGQAGAALGVQYGWKKMVFARAGYRLASAQCPVPSYLGLGVGVRCHGFRLDVSCLTASKVLGNTFSLGLGYSF